MVEIMVALGPILLIILKSVIVDRYSVDGKKKRVDYGENKEIVEGDSKKISARLSNAFDRVRRKDNDSQG